MSEWRILSPEERKLLGDEYITRYARAAGLDAWAAATPEVLDMVNKTPVLNNEFRFRRRVSPVAKNATTDKESLTAPFCPNCGAIEGQGHTLKCWKQRAEKAEALRGEANAALQWANETLADYRFKLHQAEKERDQLRVEVEEARATAREECKIVCQLRAENERLREALEKDAICSDCLIESKQGHGGCDLRSCGHARLTLGYFVAETNDAFTQQALAAKGETK